jgi:signal peptidase II
MLRSAAFFAVAVLVWGLDQAVKSWVRANLVDLQGILEHHGLWGLTYSQNRGGAFGIFPHFAEAFAGIAVLVAFAIILHFIVRPAKDPFEFFGLALLLGGVLGNLTDRLVYGWVTDFIVLPWLRRWPAFNLADAAITLGAGLLIIATIVHSVHHEEEPPNEANPV